MWDFWVGRNWGGARWWSERSSCWQGSELSCHISMNFGEMESHEAFWILLKEAKYWRLKCWHQLWIRFFFLQYSSRDLLKPPLREAVLCQCKCGIESRALGPRRKANGEAGGWNWMELCQGTPIPIASVDCLCSGSFCLWIRGEYCRKDDSTWFGL